MAFVRWGLVLAMAVIAALSVASSFGFAATSDAKQSAAVEFYCPMHPQIVQDHPGDCPICNMTLVPRPAAAVAKKAPAPSAAGPHAGHSHAAPAASTAPAAPAASQPSGSAPAVGSAAVPGLVPIELSLERVQLIGVKTALATEEALASELTTVGFVSADEAKLARVHARFSGWIERLAVATTGARVRRGDVLAEVYNLELLPAQQEFLAARRWNSNTGSAGSAPGLAAPLESAARQRLELFGMSAGEIDAVATSGKVARTIAVTAPISGHVVRKNAAQGSYVQPGTELFEIADLSKVWVLGDVFERDVARVAKGQPANFSVGAYARERFTGKIGFVYPLVDPTTRTLRVRVELDNRELKLLPGMWGDVKLELGAARGVVVPTEALVETGSHQYLFVAKPGGRFEPRLVQSGARGDGKVQILEGLAAGETVVTTANFLLDSESRLRAAIEGSP